MIVKLFDRTEYVVSQIEAEKIAKALMKSTDGFIQIQGDLIKKSAIALIKKGGYTQADLPKPNDVNKRLKSDNRSSDEKFKAARKASDTARKILIKRGILRKA